jgi:hypothetical protein
VAAVDIGGDYVMADLGDGPLEQQYEQQMRQLAKVLDSVFNMGSENGTGFVLMVFPFESGGRCNYISNAERGDVVKLMKEQIEQFEKQGDTDIGNWRTA